MATAEEIIKALRCTSSVLTENERKCDGCPYHRTEIIPEEYRAGFGGAAEVNSCDIDAAALDAADLLERMTKNA